MFGRGHRPLKAAYLRRSRASPEVTLEVTHQLRRRRRSPEEGTQVCWPAAPAAESTLPPAKPCVPEVTWEVTHQLRRGKLPRRTAPEDDASYDEPAAHRRRNASMSGRLLRPLKAVYLRRSRASSEVTLGSDAPAPAREASPEDSRTNRHQLRRARRSPEERAQKCSADGLHRTAAF